MSRTRHIPSGAADLLVTKPGGLTVGEALVIALIAGALGLYGVAGAAATIAKVLFVCFLALFAITGIAGLAGGHELTHFMGADGGRYRGRTPG